MQIFFRTTETLEHYETRWEENKNWQTCSNFEMSFVNSKIQKFFPTFPNFKRKKRKKKQQLKDNLLSSFPLRSGITKPVFPTGDTLRSVGNGRPLVLSSDSWYICLCTGCKCQFSPKRCMAAKVGTQHPQSWLNLQEMQRLLKDNSDIKVAAVRWNNKTGSPKEAGNTKQNG